MTLNRSTKCRHLFISTRSWTRTGYPSVSQFIIPGTSERGKEAGNPLLRTDSIKSKHLLLHHLIIVKCHFHRQWGLKILPKAFRSFLSLLGRNVLNFFSQKTGVPFREIDCSIFLSGSKFQRIRKKKKLRARVTYFHIWTKLLHRNTKSGMVGGLCWAAAGQSSCDCMQRSGIYLEAFLWGTAWRRMGKWSVCLLHLV